jgi:RNA polymerase sigma factor (sigma-70 family)
LHLVRSTLSGDPRATSEFLERMRCIPRFLSARNARAGHPLRPDELADLAQDVFTAFWSRLGEYRGEASLDTWAYRYCLRKWLERVRPKLRPQALDDEAPGTTTDPARHLDDAVVQAALDDLPQDESEVVVLKHLEDLSFEEIGERLRTATSTVKTRYYRGMATLRTRLGRSFREPVR